MAMKRGNNEGSIQRRSSGSWRAQVTIEGKRLSFGAKTRQECQAWLKKTIGQIDNGLTFAGAHATFGEFLAGWLVSIQSSLRLDTNTQYNQIARDHIIPTLGKIKLKDLRPDQIQYLYDAKLKAGVGPRTVQLTHAVIHRALVHAVKLGLIGRNPADVVNRPKTEQVEMIVYDENQVSQMLIAAIGDRNEVLYHLAATTGMRQSEILGLRWSDLDWEGCSLQVQRQLKRKNGAHYYYAPPKTKAGRRTVVLGKKTIEKLREHHERQQQERLQAEERWVENDLIFPSSIGTPMDQANLLKEFKKLIKAAGLPEIRFHDLRHTAASLMLNHGIPVIVASRRLGHSKPSVTLDIYGHLMPGMQNEAAELMDELVTPVNFALHPVAPKEKSPLVE